MRARVSSKVLRLMPKVRQTAALVAPASMPAPALGGVEAGLDALAGQGALELRQRAEHLEQELALRAGGVDPLGEGTERHVAFLQPVHRRQQMGQRPAQAVELPDDQTIARPQERQRFRQSRPIVTAAAGVILEQVAFIDPGAKKSVSLEVGRLTLPVRRDPHVANKHVRKTLKRRYPHITSFR